MSGRGAGGFPLPPLSPGGGAVAAALGAPPPPAGPGMLPGPALRGPGPAGGVGGPGAAAFRPMGPAGPATQYQVSWMDGRRREHAGVRVRERVPGQPPGREVQRPCMWDARDNVERKAARGPRNRQGGGGALSGQGKRMEGLKQLGGSRGFLRTGILSSWEMEELWAGGLRNSVGRGGGAGPRK